MMNNKFTTIFITACFILCMIPSVCMIFAKSDEAIGNEMQVQAPEITKENGEFNERILNDSGDYFEKHYAFRPSLITADAKIQSTIFGVSNTDTVVTGDNGWLYYSSTLDDYLGEDQLSPRGMWNLAHNLRMIENYAEHKGIKFLFTVPPNKNSLYGENMPYYYKKAYSDDHNRDYLKSALEKAGVNYLDLFEVFEDQEEILYLKEDSHWNNKGALLAYNEIMDAAGKAHDDHSDIEPVIEKVHEGDLSKMIYPQAVMPEDDYVYGTGQSYNYIKQNNSMTDEVSVEDFKIETVKEGADGNLLMYRDSFANTLIPFISEEFRTAYYSKSAPANIVKDIQERGPDYVIIEKVERNVSDFAKDPGIIPAPAVKPDLENYTLIDDAVINYELSVTDKTYVEFSGRVPEYETGSEDRIFIAVNYHDGSKKLYETYTVTREASDNEEATDYGFLAYLPVSAFGAIDDISGDMLEIYIKN